MTPLHCLQRNGKHSLALTGILLFQTIGLCICDPHAEESLTCSSLIQKQQKVSEKLVAGKLKGEDTLLQSKSGLEPPKSSLPKASPDKNSNHSHEANQVESALLVASPGAGEDRDFSSPGPRPGGDGPEAAKGTEFSTLQYALFQICCGILFYVIVGTHYEELVLKEPNEASTKLQQKNALAATFESSCANITHSICCGPARISLTLSTLGLLNFWASLFVATFMPFIFLCCVNSFTELNVKLGGERQNCFSALCCSIFCYFCLITQDAESLDRMLGVKASIVGAPVSVCVSNEENSS